MSKQLLKPDTHHNIQSTYTKGQTGGHLLLTKKQVSRNISHVFNTHKKYSIHYDIIKTGGDAPTTYESNSMQHKHPSHHSDVSIGDRGDIYFALSDEHQHRVDKHLLACVLKKIHAMCMVIRLLEQRLLQDGTIPHTESRCEYVDVFEISWTIQTHILKMYRQNISCILVDHTNSLNIYKPILVNLINDALNATPLTKENTRWVFNILKYTIVRDW